MNKVGPHLHNPDTFGQDCSRQDSSSKISDIKEDAKRQHLKKVSSFSI
jgi:hypothetical protein